MDGAGLLWDHLEKQYGKPGIIATYLEFKAAMDIKITDHTGGKGSITQWVHAEYMVGSETIHPSFTQWVRGGYFSKVPTKVPTG